MNKLAALFALAMLAGTASAQTITFDLSGSTYDSGTPVVLTLPGAVGTVTEVEYSFGVTGQNGSWVAEVSLELSSPSGTLPAPVATTAQPGGFMAATPSDAGTIVWATSPGPSWNMNPTPDINLGWPNSATPPQSTSGSSSKLNGLSSDGTWTLRIFDSYNDTGNDGVFSANSLITIHYTTGAGGAPDFGFSVSSLNFGDVEVGATSAPQEVTLTNYGDATGAVASFSIAAPYAISGGTCGATPELEPEESCTVAVTFSPTALGPVEEALSFTLAGGSEGVVTSVELNGNGVEPTGSASIGFNTGTLAFGNVQVGTTSAPQSVTLANNGTAEGSVGALDIDAPFAISGGTCGTPPFSLAPEASCTVAVTFSPTAAGAASGTLSIATPARGTITTVALSGTGTEGTPGPGPGDVQPVVANVPANSPWALAALLGLFGLIAGVALRRRG